MEERSAAGKEAGLLYRQRELPGRGLGTLAPKQAVASDIFGDLIGIWQLLKSDPARLKQAYADRWALIKTLGKTAAYRLVRERYNQAPNAEDLLFLSRTCYGGVVRFRKHDGGMSTRAVQR